MIDIDWALLFRYCGQECTSEERERFERWLDADPRHRVFFDAVVLGASRTLDVPHPTPPAPQMLAVPWERDRRARHRTRLVWATGVAAALVAVGIVAQRSGLLRAITRSPAGTVAMRTLTTRPGQRAQVDLPDGTHITLAAASTIRYPSGVAGSHRDVVLNGEAAFAVAHDPRHPFVVHAGGAIVRDVGTTFDVRAYAGDADVRVVVAEGQVDLRPSVGAARGRLLERGELARVDRHGAIEVRSVDASRYLAWTGGALVFSETPLRDVVRELGRWYGAPVTVADSALAARDFTGSFRGARLGDVLGVIAAAVHARVEWRADTARLAAVARTR